MSDALELPNGDVVEPGDVLLFEGYPYRYRAGDGPGFVLSPVYWGDSDLDLSFDSPDDLAERWGEESRGTMTAEEWERWLAGARSEDRYADAELDAIAAAVGVRDGVFDRLRRLLILIALTGCR